MVLVRSRRSVRQSATMPGMDPELSVLLQNCVGSGLNASEVVVSSLKINAERGRKREKNDVIDPDEFCGDTVCQEGEDRTTCPIDCCPNRNPTTDCGA